MKRNSTLERIRKRTGNEVKRNVDISLAIADRIYEILVTKKGKDQKYLAEFMGKHESEVCKWLSGTHNFTLQTIARIETALGENILDVTGKPVKTYQPLIIKMNNFVPGSAAKGYLSDEIGITDFGNIHINE
jgi:transcriptional regulator with XRE-family HTH domain